MNFTNNNLSNDLGGSGIGLRSDLFLSRRDDHDEDSVSSVAVVLDLFALGVAAKQMEMSMSMQASHLLLASSPVSALSSASSSSSSSSSCLAEECSCFALPIVASNPPDLYQDGDDSDVGPRILSTPVCLRCSSCSTDNKADCDQVLMESAAALFNQALFLHVQAGHDDAQQLLLLESQAKQMYHSLVHVVQNLLRTGCGSSGTIRSRQPSTWLLEMGMRVHNNLGLILYKEGDDIGARTHFQAAMLFSKQLVVVFPLHRQQQQQQQQASSYQLEHATILSNWCRVHWMRGGGGGGDMMIQHEEENTTHLFYASLREILRIRSSLLAWDHPDVAAAHFNLAAAEYARQMTQKALAHLMQYLHVAAHHRSQQQQQQGNNNNHSTATTATTSSVVVVLDPMPALIYLLLLQNEDQDDSMSQELVRGLRTLQDKRSSISCSTSSSSSSSSHSQQQNNTAAVADVASVLNFIGTLLFHKQDLEHALLFFQEELRLEEQMATTMTTTNADDDHYQQPDISVSVTCNNIGRILQELDQLEDAIVYYERALQAQYGDACRGIQYNDKAGASTKSTTTTPQHPDAESSSAAANLYSTVWYNLGLIHDKRGCYAEAIVAFKMSLELRRSMLGRDHPDIACLYYNIGVLQMEQQQLTDASDSLHEALRVRCQQQQQEQQQQQQQQQAGTSSGGGGAGTTSNQLNDERVIKTLEKLASLHKNNGAMVPAIDALSQVIRILQVSTEYDTTTRMKDLGLVLRSIAELYHTMGDVNAALIAALHSVRQLEYVAVTMATSTITTTIDTLQQQQHLATHYYNIEQLVSSLLLVGSLHHEMNEPIQADTIFRQAVVILESAIIASQTSQQPTSSSNLHLLLPSSLYALREVAAMLSMTHCAPVA
jgi:tetratricopeptide (TPR) repeat protein